MKIGPSLSGRIKYKTLLGDTPIILLLWDSQRKKIPVEDMRKQKKTMIIINAQGNKPP